MDQIQNYFIFLRFLQWKTYLKLVKIWEYGWQNCQVFVELLWNVPAGNGFLPMYFTPLIWKPHCPIPTWRFRHECVKSIEQRSTKPDYANCYLVVYSTAVEVWKSIFYAQWIQQWQNLQNTVRSLVQLYFAFNGILNAY